MDKIFIIDDNYELTERFIISYEEYTFTQPYIMLDIDLYPHCDFTIYIPIDGKVVTIYSVYADDYNFVEVNGCNTDVYYEIQPRIITGIQNDFTNAITDSHIIIMQYLLHLVPWEGDYKKEFTNTLCDIITAIRESYPDLPTGL